MQNSFLTIPAFKLVLAEVLPTTHYLNFTDVLFIWVILVITFNLLTGKGGYYYFQNNKVDIVYRLKRVSRMISPLYALAAFLFCDISICYQVIKF